MILIDRLLAGGVRFVLNTLASVADQELNDSDRLREDLLAAQMQLELGEISEDEFAAVERDVLARLRQIREEEVESREALDIRNVEVSIDADLGER